MTKKHPNQSNRPPLRQRKYSQEGNFSSSNNNNSGHGGHDEDHHRHQRPQLRSNPPPRQTTHEELSDPMKEALYNDYKSEGTRGTHRPFSPIEDCYESYEGIIGNQEYRPSNRYQNPNPAPAPVRRCVLPAHPCFEDDRRAEVLRNVRDRQNEEDLWGGGLSYTRPPPQNNSNNLRPANNNSSNYEDLAPPLVNRVQNMHVDDRGSHSGWGDEGRFNEGPRRNYSRQDVRRPYNVSEDYRLHMQQQQSGSGFGRQEQQHQGGSNGQNEQGHGSQENRQSFGRQEQQNGYDRRHDQHGGYDRKASRGQALDRHQALPMNSQQPREPQYEQQWEQRPTNTGSLSAREQYPPRRDEQPNHSYRGFPSHSFQSQHNGEYQCGWQQQWQQLRHGGYQRNNSDQGGFGDRSFHNYYPEHHVQQPQLGSQFYPQWPQLAQGGSARSGYDQSPVYPETQQPNRSYEEQGSSRQQQPAQRRQEEPANLDNMVVRGNRFQQYEEQKKKREAAQKKSDECGNTSPKKRSGGRGRGSEQENDAPQESAQREPLAEPIMYRNGQIEKEKSSSSAWRYGSSFDSESPKKKESQQRFDDFGRNGCSDQKDQKKTSVPKQFQDEKPKKKENEDEQLRRLDLLERMSHLDDMLWNEEMNRVDAAKSESSVPEEEQGFVQHPAFMNNGGRPNHDQVLWDLRMKYYKDDVDSSETPIMGATSDQEDW